MWGGSVERNCEPMNQNRIEGVAKQGERARNREALVIKARWRRSGGCAVKECVLTAQISPAMQAGISDHVWNLEEIAKLAD